MCVNLSDAGWQDEWDIRPCGHRSDVARFAAMPARQVVVVAFPGIQSLDVSGPVEVFHGAGRAAGGACEVAGAPRGGPPVPATSGILVGGGVALDDVGAIDTLIVAGGQGSRPGVVDPALVEWLRRRGPAARPVAAGRPRAPDARRVASVCTGAFLLAQAGLLDGRRVTTHWSACDALARRHPEVDVEPEPIFTRHGKVKTPAAVTRRTAPPRR